MTCDRYPAPEQEQEQRSGVRLTATADNDYSGCHGGGVLSLGGIDAKRRKREGVMNRRGRRVSVRPRESGWLLGRRIGMQTQLKKVQCTLF